MEHFSTAVDNWVLASVWAILSFIWVNFWIEVLETFDRDNALKHLIESEALYVEARDKGLILIINNSEIQKTAAAT